MRNEAWRATAVLLAFSFVAWAQVPATRQDNVREVIHNVEIVDPYRWLEDQDSAETRKWIEAQNAYAHSLLDPQVKARPLITRLTEMLRHDQLSAPIQRGGSYFFSKRSAGRDQWSIYRRRGVDGRDELLIDPAPLSKDQTTSVSMVGVVDDGTLLAYGVRRGGEDETDLHVFNVEKRKDLSDSLPRALYQGFAWKKDGSGFFYTVGLRGKGRRLHYHQLGTNTANDAEVFGKDLGTDTWIEPVVSETGRYLLIVAQHGWARADLYFQNLSTGEPIRPLVTGIDAKFRPMFAGDVLFVQTDWQAPRSRVMKIDLRDPAREKWREVVPESQDSIEDTSVVGGKLFVNYLHNVSSRISIFSLDGTALGEVALPGLGSASLDGRADQEEGVLQFTSYTTPASIYRYSAKTGTQTLWHREAIPFDSGQFQIEQVWYPSKDGTRIPMFLIHRKGLKPDGKTPTILYGYGGFNVSITPGFQARIAWWIEQGGLYAVANLRGGGEFGEAWHRAGMLANKQNVFDDFIAGAEWLIREKYTNPQKLAISGGSNGGLLVASVMTERPELFQAVLCWHPDLDMVRYYKFTKNNNPPALLEYGNAEDPEQFKFLYAYSPYQKVRKGVKYPAMLLTSGDADTRVPPEQARKMAARLQAATASDRPVLLLYDTKAGHAGGMPLSKTVEDMSLELAFLAWQLGMAETER